MLMRFDPFSELDRLSQRFGRQVGMPMDAYRHDGRVVAHFDIPGIDPGSIELTVDRDVLNVSATRTWEPEEGTEVLVAERLHGTVRRQLYLGDSVDTEHIAADYHDGVLTVTIPLAAQSQPRRVAVASGRQSEAIEAKAAA